MKTSSEVWFANKNHGSAQWLISRTVDQNLSKNETVQPRITFECNLGRAESVTIVRLKIKLYNVKDNFVILLPLKYSYNNPKSPNIELYFKTNYAWNRYCTILEKMRVMVKLDFWMFLPHISLKVLKDIL